MANGGRIEYTVGFKVDSSNLQSLRNQLSDLSKISNVEFFNKNSSKFGTLEKASAEMKNIRHLIHEVEDAYDGAFDSTTGVTNVNKLASSLRSIGVDKLEKSFKQLGIEGTKAWNQITSQITQTNLKFKETNNFLTKIGETLTNTIKWGIASSALNRFTGSIQQAWGYVQHLDTSLNDIRIVTGKSADEMDNFAVKANNAAKSLGQSTTAYTEAALIYYQQGLSDEESQARAETTLKAANVTGQTGREVSEQLTAVWNGYKVSAEETELYVDKLAAVAATTASDLEELSTGMSKVASAANNMGVDIDQLNAQLATIVSVTRQAPETAGTALKTIYARMEDLKIGGEDESGVKLGDVSSTLEAVGISVMDTQGDLRDLGEVIEEVAAKWDTWTGAQQNAIAQALAGKRQYNNLLALFDNWDMYTNALETSRNSMGTLQKQQDIYMESTAAHLQQLKTEWEDLYDSLIDTNDINGVLDLFTSGLDKITDFVDAIGGGKSVLAGMIALLGQIPGISSAISNQLGSVIGKFLNAKYNAVEWANAQKRVLETLPNSTHAKVFKEISDYENILTNQNKEEILQLTDQVDLLEKKKNAQQDSLDLTTKEIQLRAKGLNAANSIGEEQYLDIQNKEVGTSFSGKEQEDFNFVLDEQVDKLDEAKQAFKEYMQAAEETASAQEKFNKAVEEGDVEKQDKYFDQLVDSVDELAEKRKKFEEPLQVFKDTNDKDIKNILNTADQLEKEFNSLEADSQTLGRSLEKVGKEGKEGFENIGQGIKTAKQNFNTLVPAVAETSEALNKARKDLQEYIEGIAVNNFADGITKAISGLSALAFGIQAIQNLGSIWKNEDASTGEKILSTITALGTALPMVMTGLSSLQEGFGKIKVGLSSTTELFASYLSGQEAINAAKIITKNLDDEQIVTLLKLAEVENIETTARKISNGEIDEEIAKTIIDTTLKEKEIGTSITLGTVLKTKLATGFATVTAGIKATALALKELWMAQPLILKIIEVVVAAAAAITKVIIEVKKARAEAAAASAEANLDIAQKDYENAEKYAQAVKEVANAYEDLSEKYKNQEISLPNLRSQIYDLIKAHDIQVDAVDVLTASYEELNQIMQNVSSQATKSQNDAQKALIDAQKQNVIAQSQKYTSENATVWKDYIKGSVSNANLSMAIYNETGVEAMSNVGNMNWDAFYNASQEQRDAIISILEDYESFNSRAKDALNAIRENQSAWDEAQATEKEYNKNVANAIYEELSTNQEITSATDYNDVKEKLTNQIVEELQISYDEALKIAEETLNSQEGLIKINAGFSLGEQLSENYNKDVEELANQISSLSTSDIDFLEGNIDLAKSYESLEDFLAAYKDIREALQRKDNMLKIQTVFTNADGEQFKPEDIADMFADKEFSTDFGKTQEDFENQTYEQQMSDLLTYYLTANKLETDFENSKKQALIDEQNAKIAALEEEQGSLDEIAAKIKETYNVDDTALEEGYNNILNNSFETAAQNMNTMYGYDIMESDAGVDILEKYIQGKEDLNDIEQEYIKYLAEANGVSTDELNIVYNNLKAYEDFTDQLEKAGIEGKSFSKIASQLDDQLAEVQGVVSDIDLSQIDWGAFGKGVEQLFKHTQDGIDSVQGAYSSLTSVMEEYNETGIMSMDNLQTILSMDTQYLSALQMENGQLVLNEDSLKQIALARLDEAEAEAYMQAMTELNNEERRQEILSSGQAVTSLQALGGAAANAAEAARGGIDAWNKYWEAALHQQGKEKDAYTEMVGNSLRTKLQAIDTVRQQIMSGNGFSTTMKGPEKASSSSGASSKEKEADHEDYLERETDLYRAINEELDDIESTLGRIQEFDDHSWGLTAKKALEQENKLLKQQLDMLEKKKDTYERDLGARRGALESQGINFSEDGSVMTNAEDKINQLYGEYNAMVDKYNAMSADDQESFKETLEAKKDSIDEIEDAIDKYEDGYNDYNSVLDELLDTHYELIENEVNHFNADIDVHLELDEAEQEWNDFWYEVVKDIEDEDFAGRIAQSVGKLNTLIGTVGKTRDSQVAELTNHLNEVTAEVRAQIAAAARGGEGSLFQDDSALSKENLENYRDQLMDAVRTAKEEIDEMTDTYLEALDHAQDLIDDQVEGWEAIGDHIEHDLELIQMVSGDKAFDALNKQFEQQYKNNLQLIQTQRMSTEYWQERMKYYEQMMTTEQEGSEMYKMYSDALETASENYRKAVSDLDKTVEDALKKLEEWRKNQVAEITDSLDKALSKNMGLEDLKQQWDLVVEEQDYYLDNVERAIEMEGLQNEFDDVLNAMDARGAKQQEFLKWQDEELRKLNEKNKLTQYDIDEVKARLELKRQELALEEAQQNKSNLRLRRDSQGNYTYQYVADEGNVEDAEDKMLTAKREWYELVKKRNEETTNEVIDIRKRLLEAENEMAEALAAHNDEAYENAKARYEFLIEYEKELMEEGEKAKRDFYSGTAEFFADVNDNQILPMWDTTIQQMIDKWDNGGKDSFIGATIAAIGDLEEVQRQFGNHTEEILYTAGVNYQDLVERGIDPTTEALEDMQDSNEVLNVSLEETNDLMNQLADELSVAIDAYNSLKDAAVNAIREANDALETLARTAIETSQQVQSAIAAANSAANAMANMKAAASSRGSGGGGGGSYGPSSSKSPRERKRLELVDDPYGVAGTKAIREVGTSNYLEIVGDETISDRWTHDVLKRKYEDQGYIVPFKSGGYTGEWNDINDGRLAVLHQKELVLNESDTTNILNAVKAVRDIVSAQASPNFSGIADSIANMAAMQASAFAQIGSSMLSAIASSVNNNNSDVSNYRNMTVNADFSGVRSADAIYQALRELENYGAQQAYSSAPHANSSY